MRDSDNLPAGAVNDTSAPYNEQKVPEKEFEIDVTVVLTKTCTVKTNDYIPDGDDADTYNTDWNKAYKDSHLTLPQMLEELKRYVEREIDERVAIGQEVPDKLRQLLLDTRGWEEVELDCG